MKPLVLSTATGNDISLDAGRIESVERTGLSTKIIMASGKEHYISDPYEDVIININYTLKSQDT